MGKGRGRREGISRCGKWGNARPFATGRGRMEKGAFSLVVSLQNTSGGENIKLRPSSSSAHSAGWSGN